MSFVTLIKFLFPQKSYTDPLFTLLSTILGWLLFHVAKIDRSFRNFHVTVLWSGFLLILFDLPKYTFKPHTEFCRRASCRPVATGGRSMLLPLGEFCRARRKWRGAFLLAVRWASSPRLNSLNDPCASFARARSPCVAAPHLQRGWLGETLCTALKRWWLLGLPFDYCKWVSSAYLCQEVFTTSVNQVCEICGGNWGCFGSKYTARIL